MEPNINTTEKILAAIETQHVKPRPKWYFVVRNILLWIPGLITTLLGAYAVSGILYGVLHAHLFENRLYTSNTTRLASLIAIPVLWIISFGIFSLITILFLRKTDKGYRHPAVQLLSLSLTGSVMIGILFYALTIGSLAGPSALYRYPTQHQNQAIWNDAEHGRISGVIMSIQGSTVMLTDFRGVTWAVNTAQITDDDQLALLKKSNAIRIVGIVTADHTFSACRVLQWELFPEEMEVEHVIITDAKAIPSCTTILAHPAQ